MFELVMIGNKNLNDLAEFRAEAKTILNEFYSVQFFLNDKEILYQFKLRNISSNGPCILVKQDSPVFTELQVGDILDMEYSKSESSGASKLFKTKITSKNSHDCYTGHSIVELTIIDKKDPQTTSLKNKAQPIISETNKAKKRDPGKAKPRPRILDRKKVNQQDQLKLF
jgi:hypothetical protein